MKFQSNSNELFIGLMLMLSMNNLFIYQIWIFFL